jgi:hypothetical protein
MEVIIMKNKLNTQENTKNTYTKEMLIKKIAEVSGKNVHTVRIIYNTFEKIIADMLSSANYNTDISLRLFEGVSINSSFVPEQTKMNNLTGNIMTSASKIKAKANITRYYCEKLTNYNK